MLAPSLMDSSTLAPDFEAPGLDELQPLFPAYRLEGFIAQGGMGAVYMARQLSLDRPVAIKILPKVFGDDPQFRAAFEAEAKAMARLNHPNLIGVYDFGDANGMPFIVMEYVDGKSLYYSAHGKAIEQTEVARLVSQICRGLAHAHEAGILHRDIKPANILLAAGAVPKIGDFGLARPLADRHDTERIVFGTPGYAAPEVAAHPERVDQRADIFAVGALSYELLTAQLPPSPWRPPSSVSGCAKEFDAITRRATHPSPDMRFGSADEIADELDRLLPKLPKPGLLSPAKSTSLKANLPSGTRPFPSGTRPFPTAARPLVTPPLRSARKSRLAPVAIVLLVIGIGVMFALIASNRDRPRASRTAPPPRSSLSTPSPRPERTPPKRPPVRPARKEPPAAATSPAPENEVPRSTTPDKEPPDEQPPPESVTEALARLQPNLQRGDLTKLPPGTIQRRASHFLLVPTSLPWREAARFAERHGGQLAVFESPRDLDWAASQFDSDQPVWLGLSDSGTEGRWHWIDGRPAEEAPWAPRQPDDTPSNDDGEDFAALLPGLPQLDDLPGSRSLPFVIEWRDDKTYAGSLARQLQRTAADLEARKSPVFPAGARNINGSRFLLVPHDGSWNRASALATSAGAHLAVPSSPDEAAGITEILRSTLEPGQGCWVGGRLQAPRYHRWEFVTGEKFDFVNWAPDEPGDDPSLRFLKIRRAPDSPALQYSPSSETAGDIAYAILEWSAPSRRNMPGEEEQRAPSNADDWLAALREKIRRQYNTQYQRFKTRWDRNVEDFIKDIKDEVDAPKAVMGKAVSEFVKRRLDTVAKEGRVPPEVPASSPYSVVHIHQRALRKQDRIWEDFRPDFERARNEYLNKLESRIETLTRVVDREGARFLTRELEAASDDPQRFHAILNGENPPVPVPQGNDNKDDNKEQKTERQQGKPRTMMQDS